MPIFRKAVDRLSDLLRRDGKVTYTARIDAREARYLAPMLDRITAEGEDGEALRFFLIRSMQGERPPIEIYRGSTSVCRIDGPWQVMDSYCLPLGGLILTPGITAHLDPFQAKALHRQMQEAIEIAIEACARDQDLYSLPDATDAINRAVNDPAAKIMIEAWVVEQQSPICVEPVRPRDDRPGDASLPLCALCGRRLARD